ncbi:MAG: hypothetical protein FWC73_06230 [Defluviitaleaceae bacterium]|nr:hypothetical protein [Defluviitaleaceae bacterium]
MEERRDAIEPKVPESNFNQGKQEYTSWQLKDPIAELMFAAAQTVGKTSGMTEINAAMDVIEKGYKVMDGIKNRRIKRFREVVGILLIVVTFLLTVYFIRSQTHHLITISFPITGISFSGYVSGRFWRRGKDKPDGT